MEIPNTINNYSVWLSGSRVIGMADVTLPNITNLTDEVKGAGIGGTITYPVMAHFDDMTTTFRFHTITSQAVNLLRQDCMHIEARAGVQYHDPGPCKIIIGAWRFVMQVLPRAFNLGKLDVGTKEEVECEMDVAYIKGVRDGEDVFEIDKFNLICKVLGHDYGSAIRQALGI